MLPYIVLTAAILYFLLKRIGLFDQLSQSQGQDRRSQRRKQIMRKIEEDPELSKRLDVFKDFLDNQNDEDA